jgi:Asp/Glu/hydantoin racemase
MADESLIKNTITAGHLTPETTRRVATLVGVARDGGAAAVMVTCSSIGAAVNVARSLYDIPVFRIDEAMAREAVTRGPRIGVAATLRTTLEPTVALLDETARQAGRDVTVLPALFEGAFEAVVAGDTARHDKMVTEGLADLRGRSDVVVLAQASMARVLPGLGPDGAPILASPELAVRHMREALDRLAIAAAR